MEEEYLSRQHTPVSNSQCRNSIRTVADDVCERLNAAKESLSADELAHATGYRRRRIYDVMIVLQVMGWVEKNKKKYTKTAFWGQDYSHHDVLWNKPYHVAASSVVKRDAVTPQSRYEYTICNVLQALGVFVQTEKHVYKRRGVHEDVDFDWQTFLV